MDWRELTTALAQAVSTFDTQQVERLTAAMIAKAYDSSQPCPEPVAKETLDLLRRNRHVYSMAQWADVLLSTGQRSPRVRRQYAQALIDQGQFSAALLVLESLAGETESRKGPEDVRENEEAHGLIGRVYKELYLRTDGSNQGQRQKLLNRSIEHYGGIYLGNSSAVWHGINVAAMTARGQRDGLEADPRFEVHRLASDLLTTLGAEDEASRASLAYWDMATIIEAYVALDRVDKALDWCGRYISCREKVDAFELSSTLRQFSEVWRLGSAGGPGGDLLSVLRAALVRRSGGSAQFGPQSVGDGGLLAANDEELQKILGVTGAQTVRWYREGLHRCALVARVETEFDQPLGTGFLVRGGDFIEQVGDRPLLLTNSHVLEAGGLTGSDPAGARLRFEAYSPKRGEVVEQGLGKMVWSSPQHELDAALMEVEGDVLGEAEPTSQFAPMARNPPKHRGKRAGRIYAIGHPGGRSLHISLQDNLLIDFRDPKLHYRTPTECGSSGSPLFDQNWRLVGIHRAGDRQMPKLDGSGLHAANEGVWIGAIRDRAAGEGPVDW